MWIVFLQFAVCAAAGDLTLQISNETAPAGGWAQIKIFAATPAQITFGRIVMNFDPTIFGPIANVAVFSPQGDAEGIASVNDRSLDADFESASAGIGQLLNLPIPAITVPILPSAAAGTKSAITLDTSKSTLGGPNQTGYTVLVNPGSVTVGGNLSIQNLAPGGGLLASGTVVRVNGTGFSAATTINIDGVSIANAQFIGPNEIDLTLGGAADPTGKHVVATNPDGSQVEFYSASSSVPDQTTEFNGIWPMISMQTWTGAVTGQTTTGVGIAIQNPNQVPVDVVLESTGPGGIENEAKVTIPAGQMHVYSRDQQFTGLGFLAFADVPLRMLGIVSQTASIYQSFTLPSAMQPATPPVQQFMATPTAVSFTSQVGAATPTPVSVNLSSVGSRAPNPAITWTGAPFSVTQTSTTLNVTVNPSGLAPGLYAGSITIQPEGPNAVTTTIPLSLTVTASAVLIAPATVNVCGPPVCDPAAVKVNSDGDPIPFTATLSGGPPGGISIIASSAITPGTVTLSVSNQLSAGVYTASLILAGPNNTVTVPIQIVIESADPHLQFSPPSVTFVAAPGSVPAKS